MSSSHVDRNLLFGFLALQNDFIAREELIAAVSVWLTDKSQSLEAILRQRRVLADDEYELVAALARKHLQRHGDDAEKSLESLSSVGKLREDLKKLGDNDVQASLLHVSAARRDEEPQFAQTLAPDGSAPVASRFRILRPHAEGGLGQVFVAKDEELNREVALKEIKLLRADDLDSRSRFMLEAEITGGLEHPGIVPVYGLGQYADGRPFYAMRFIRGDSLAEAVDRFHQGEQASSRPEKRPHKRSFDSVEFRQLLGRFIDVCNAIEYAHSRGVLHRDLKPGNIMLGKYGETLVVDWGLAKAKGRDELHLQSDEHTLQPRSTSGSAATQMGSAIGTPAYMSPEQAAGRLDQLGPASDVYSLGATLYYVLTGQTPFDKHDGIGAILRKVQAGEFRAPREINKNIPNSLNAICLKAMRREPQDRYASPLALAGDIERLLADEPVAACTESRLVRARRWLRKHPRSVAALVATLLVATLGAAIISTMATLAQAKEEKARRRGEAVLQYLVKGFRSPDPTRDPRTMTLAEMLGRLAKNLKVADIADPLTKMEILYFTGMSYSGLGLNDQALPLLEEGRALIVGALGEDHPDALMYTNNLAFAYESAGQFDKAVLLLEQTVKRKRAKLGEDHPSTLASLNNLGRTYQNARQFEKAILLMGQRYERNRVKLGESHPETLNWAHYLAHAHQKAGQLDKALPLYEQTLERRRVKLGEDHPDALLLMNHLATAYFTANQPAKALLLLDRYIKGRRARSAPDDPDFALVVSLLCLDLLKHEQYSDAEPYLRECLAIREKKLTDNWLTFSSKSMLGAALLGQQKYADAEPLMLAGYEGMKRREEKIPPQGRVRLTEAIQRLVDLYTAWEKPAEAENWKKVLEEHQAAPHI